MRLEGSCHCGAVRFSCESPHPVPYQRCYCSICRKTAGGSGYAINIMGKSETLEIEGGQNIAIYRTRAEDGNRSGCERRFCARCGSALWVYDSRWPELIHPFASAIDSNLPTPGENTHMMLAFKPAWVEPHVHPSDKTFERYPDESIADWHKRTDNVRD
ncbi:GFA family protein [Oricola sp.]|uniref:GFA family protein n=1 Tax=Oricola sp. TaxID=1979950 RepID=UPI003BAA9EEE